MAEAGCGIAIVTLGSEGSIIFDGVDFFSIPAYKTATVDTTGAGDAYFAGFTKQLLDAQPLADCGAFASTIAGMMIESSDGLSFNFKMEDLHEKSLELSEAVTIR
jgi:sugar/nucleoside kinase (ribokinase family)